MIKIVDTYSGNRLELDKWKAEGYVGVIFKAGQGEWPDVPRVHPDWWGLAKEAGFRRGWYWLADSRYHSSNHIKAMQTHGILADTGELGLWIDVEKPVIAWTEAQYFATKYHGYKNVQDIVYLCTQNGVKPGIYTGPGAYELVTRDAPQSAHDYFALFDLWTAQYPYIYTEGVSKPKLFGAWKDWTWWQFREGPDVSNFNGTEEQFLVKYPNIPNARGKMTIGNKLYEES